MQRRLQLGKSLLVSCSGRLGRSVSSGCDLDATKAEQNFNHVLDLRSPLSPGHIRYYRQTDGNLDPEKPSLCSGMALLRPLGVAASATFSSIRPGHFVSLGSPNSLRSKGPGILPHLLSFLVNLPACQRISSCHVSAVLTSSAHVVGFRGSSRSHGYKGSLPGRQLCVTGAPLRNDGGERHCRSASSASEGLFLTRARPPVEELLKGIQARAYSSIQGTPGGPSGPAGLEGFGDLTSQTIVTDDMLDSLIALKDFGNIEGLPPLDQILEEDEERDKRAIRREMEKKKQLEIAAKRVKIVDELGRAYGTGRRKASTARVWIKEGEGKMTINGLPHDIYFPDIDQRLQLLEPFWETNQLGVFDVRATVKGGGVSGQSGALRHGISKALQLYDPNLRPALKSAGMLTRDSRVVERKKPGKAKARKSFQWVKR